MADYNTKKGPDDSHFHQVSPGSVNRTNKNLRFYPDLS